MKGQPTCASNCFRRGDADASTTLLPLIIIKAGRSSGRGARRGRGEFEDAGVVTVSMAADFWDASYAGGRSCFSDMMCVILVWSYSATDGVC